MIIISWKSLVILLVSVTASTFYVLLHKLFETSHGNYLVQRAASLKKEGGFSEHLHVYPPSDNAELHVSPQPNRALSDLDDLVEMISIDELKEDLHFRLEAQQFHTEATLQNFEEEKPEEKETEQKKNKGKEGKKGGKSKKKVESDSKGSKTASESGSTTKTKYFFYKSSRTMENFGEKVCEYFRDFELKRFLSGKADAKLKENAKRPNFFELLTKDQEKEVFDGIRKNAKIQKINLISVVTSYPILVMPPSGRLEKTRGLFGAEMFKSQQKNEFLRESFDKFDSTFSHFFDYLAASSDSSRDEETKEKLGESIPKISKFLQERLNCRRLVLSSKSLVSASNPKPSVVLDNLRIFASRAKVKKNEKTLVLAVSGSSLVKPLPEIFEFFETKRFFSDEFEFSDKNQIYALGFEKAAKSFKNKKNFVPLFSYGVLFSDYFLKKNKKINAFCKKGSGYLHEYYLGLCFLKMNAEINKIHVFSDSSNLKIRKKIEYLEKSKSSKEDLRSLRREKFQEFSFLDWIVTPLKFAVSKNENNDLFFTFSENYGPFDLPYGLKIPDESENAKYAFKSSHRIPRIQLHYAQFLNILTKSVFLIISDNPKEFEDSKTWAGELRKNVFYFRSKTSKTDSKSLSFSHESPAPSNVVRVPDSQWRFHHVRSYEQRPFVAMDFLLRKKALHLKEEEGREDPRTDTEESGEVAEEGGREEEQKEVVEGGGEEVEDGGEEELQNRRVLRSVDDLLDESERLSLDDISEFASKGVNAEEVEFLLGFDSDTTWNLPAVAVVLLSLEKFKFYEILKLKMETKSEGKTGDLESSEALALFRREDFFPKITDKKIQFFEAEQEVKEIESLSDFDFIEKVKTVEAMNVGSTNHLFFPENLNIDERGFFDKHFTDLESLRKPFVLGGYIYDAWESVYPTGGAGIISSREGAFKILEDLDKGRGKCVQDGLNFDVLFGHCWRQNEKVHISGLFQPEWEKVDAGFFVGLWANVSIHKSKERLSLMEEAFGFSKLDLLLESNAGKSGGNTEKAEKIDENEELYFGEKLRRRAQDTEKTLFDSIPEQGVKSRVKEEYTYSRGEIRSNSMDTSKETKARILTSSPYRRRLQSNDVKKNTILKKAEKEGFEFDFDKYETLLFPNLDSLPADLLEVPALSIDVLDSFLLRYSSPSSSLFWAGGSHELLNSPKYLFQTSVEASLPPLHHQYSERVIRGICTSPVMVRVVVMSLPMIDNFVEAGEDRKCLLFDIQFLEGSPAPRPLLTFLRSLPAADWTFVVAGNVRIDGKIMQKLVEISGAGKEKLSQAALLSRLADVLQLDSSSRQDLSELSAQMESSEVEHLPLVLSRGHWKSTKENVTPFRQLLFGHGLLLNRNSFLKLKSKDSGSKDSGACRKGSTFSHDQSFSACLANFFRLPVLSSKLFGCNKKQKNCLTYTERLECEEGGDLQRNIIASKRDDRASDKLPFLKKVLFPVISDSPSSCKEIWDAHGQIVKSQMRIFSSVTGKFSKCDKFPDLSVTRVSVSEWKFNKHTPQHEQRLFVALKNLVRKNYASTRHIDWFVGFDSDTTWNLEALGGVLQRLEAFQGDNPGLGIIGGYLFHGGYSYPTGGAGILIDKRAAEVLLNWFDRQICDQSPGWASDAMLGICVLSNRQKKLPKKIKFVHIEGMLQNELHKYAQGHTDSMWAVVTAHRPTTTSLGDNYRKIQELSCRIGENEEG